MLDIGGWGTFVTTLESLPDWAESYDPSRSLDHARKLQKIRIRRKNAPKP